MPKAFYAFDKRLKMFGAPEDRSTRSPSGLYDRHLVIHETESKILAPLDDYAIRFLRKETAAWQMFLDDGEVLGFAISGADQRLLKLFYLSVMWRAHASTRRELEHLDLGATGEEVASMIIAGDAGRRDRFPVKLYMLEDVDPEVIPLAPPFLAEVDGQRAVVSIFGGALASVYLDGSPPDDIGVLGANEPLLVASMSWRGSSLREIAKQNVLENYLRFGNPFPKQTRRSLQTLKKK